MERKLATIRRIKDIQPIEGADRIELCKVEGWQVVSQKGIHNVGDLVVYIEIDSLIPEVQEFEFLRKSGSLKTMADGSKGFRIKTIRLKKCLSQGLIMPLSILNITKVDLLDPSGYTPIDEGKDVTALLGIKLYEAPVPACLSGIAKGMFPGFIPKTDAERIQNLYDEYKEKYKNVPFEVTEKADGASVTYYLKDDKFGVCSRNLELIEQEGNTLWKMARSLKIEEFLRDKGRNVAIQGEMIGESIQGNPYRIKGQRFLIFNIWDIDNRRHLESIEKGSFLNNTNLYPEGDLETVPTISLWKFPFADFNNIDEMLIYSEGKSIINDRDVDREGLVYKSMHEVDGQILNFKVINNKYLLEEK